MTRRAAIGRPRSSEYIHSNESEDWEARDADVVGISGAGEFDSAESEAA